MNKDKAEDEVMFEVTGKTIIFENEGEAKIWFDFIAECLHTNQERSHIEWRKARAKEEAYASRVNELETKIKVMEKHIGDCYDKEKTLHQKNKDQRERNEYLEDKYKQIREIALGPWEKYSHHEDKMGK